MARSTRKSGRGGAHSDLICSPGLMIAHGPPTAPNGGSGRQRFQRKPQARSGKSPGSQGRAGAILLVVPGLPDAEEELPGRRVPVRLPPWLGGNDILQCVREAGLKAVPVDASTFRWELETRESYEHRSPGLVTVSEMAGPGSLQGWERLRRLADPGVASAVPRERLLAERDRILAGHPGDFAACAAALHLVVSTIGHAGMADAAREGYESLAALRDQHGRLLFPELAARFIDVSPVLMRRLALARVLMHIEEEPELLEHRPAPPPGKTAFGSGWHLTSDLALTRDAYFTPLFLAASPWVWPIVCPRLPGLIVYDLGRCVVGRRGEPTELLQVFFPPGNLASGDAPPISSAHTTAATAWWVRQMDTLLSELSDFSNYCDPGGSFVPRRQFEVFMSIEQLGRRLQGILAHDRDLATRRALAFDAFDTLKGLGIIDLFEGCKLSRAERTLGSLEQVLPPQAIELLLLPARRAILALQSLQAGFLPARLTGGAIRLPDRHGGNRDWSLDDAVGLYLQLLRNANHGFTPERDANERRDQILLMAHDGYVPGDFAFLPYLYWLDVLAHPGRFRPRLRPRPRGST